MSNTVEQEAPLRITISEVKNLLNQGKSRKEIAQHYGKTMAEMQRAVWSNPKLKNLKAKKQYTGIELEDDEEDVVAETTSNTAEEVASVVTSEGAEVTETLGEEVAVETSVSTAEDWK